MTNAANTLPPPYDQLLNELARRLPAERLIHDPLRTLAYGTDASFYRLVPKLVVDVVDEQEVIAVLELANRHRVPVTFRAAGTSLSGQAVTDSVLLRMKPDAWRAHWINDDATEIRLQPGVIGGSANRYLAAHGRKIGPDPASINAAKIGGIAANNASGMCCGVAQNSYHTLAGMRIILVDGTVLDTGDAASRTAFAASHAELLAGLDRLARDTRADEELAARIREKFKIKNTTGYSLNALVDFDDPIDILQHLMIGSEGTLGFIAEITYRTVPEHPHKASALVFFPDIGTACEAVAALKQEPVEAVEIMDRAAIRSVQHKPGMPDYLRELPEGTAALLIETRAAEPQRLQEQIQRIAGVLQAIETVLPAEFSDEEAEYTRYWNIRKGLFPSVGAMREVGTTVIIEDVAFPIPKLAAGTLALQALFDKHGYHEAIIFGHALEGNLHFVITPDFSHAAEVDRYEAFMDELCHMVVERYDGSLKAEHGTGRNIAPYTELEWGSRAYQLMQEIKRLLDPQEFLNPGVILNQDPRIHVKNLKPLHPVDARVDKCIECGFCEPFCPSRSLSLTPRQRIVGLREVARLQHADAGDADAARLDGLYQYQGVDTCAGDSLCSIACPVDIDTGKMMKTLRGRRMPGVGRRIGTWAARHFGPVAVIVRVSLFGAHTLHRLLGSRLMAGLTGGLRRLSADRIPLWNPYMPTAVRAPRATPTSPHPRPRVVYYPSCAARTMGPARGDPERESLTAVTERLLRKAGYDVVYPDSCDELCCGMPFESKGLLDQAERKAGQLEERLAAASRGGKDPIVFDTSPCAHRIKTNTGLQLYDITEFIHDVLLDRLNVTPVAGTVAVHSTCSTTKMGLEEKLRHIAEACARHVVVPDGVTCCGWAGDRGFTYPELNASAVQLLRSGLPPECDAGYSTSRSCEIGLSLHSGRYYRSIVYLVDRCASTGGTADVAVEDYGHAA